jgi:hypothetical protein
MKLGADSSALVSVDAAPGAFEGVRARRLREVAGLLILLGGLASLALVGHAHYPIQHWLFWRFAAYWLASTVWAAACVSGGSFALRRLAIDMPAAEELVSALRRAFCSSCGECSWPA